jgi:hypothetical protein
MMNLEEGDPVQFIRLVIVPNHSGDPDAEPTPDQLELVKRYRADLGQALSQHQSEFGRRILESDDRSLDRGRRLILKVQRAMLGIRPHKLRGLINDATNDLRKDFESSWSEWRKWKWRQKEAEEMAYYRAAAGESKMRRRRDR